MCKIWLKNYNLQSNVWGFQHCLVPKHCSKFWYWTVTWGLMFWSSKSNTWTIMNINWMQKGSYQFYLIFSTIVYKNFDHSISIHMLKFWTYIYELSICTVLMKFNSFWLKLFNTGQIAESKLNMTNFMNKTIIYSILKKKQN